MSIGEGEGEKTHVEKGEGEGGGGIAVRVVAVGAGTAIPTAGTVSASRFPLFRKNPSNCSSSAHLRTVNSSSSMQHSGGGGGRGRGGGEAESVHGLARLRQRKLILQFLLVTYIQRNFPGVRG